MNRIKELLRPKLKLLPGTRLTSFLFIAVSIAIAAGILFAANLYYDIDTGQIVYEETQKATRLVKAIAGLVIGSDTTLPSGVALEVATSSAVRLSGADQELRFTGGTNYYVGLKANTALSTTTVYILPTSTAPAVDYYLTVNPATGQMSWGVPSGAGDIQAVGNVETGRAFTSDLGTTYGNILWFHPDSNYTMALTAASGLGANATTIIPALSGTNYLTLTPSALTSGQVLLATGNYTLGGNANLAFDTGNRILTIGSSGNSGQLRIFNGSYYLGFAATSTMTTNTLYYWPQNFGSSNQVLTTDGSGNLTWQSLSGVGGVTGTGTANRLAKWTGTSSIGNASIEDTGTAVWITISDTTTTISNILDPNEVAGFTLVGDIAGSGSPNITGIGNLLANYVEATTLQIATIRSAADTDITLNPRGDSAGKVVLGSGDWIETASGYKIGESGTQVLREIAPIMGFDLPVQTATTGWAQISRLIENYPFSTTSSGTTRVHKLVFRYAASTTNPINVRINAEGNPNYSTTTLPVPESTNLNDGQLYIVQIDIPTDGTDWQVDVQTVATPDTVRIYQLFLAAYDQIQ